MALRVQIKAHAKEWPAQELTVSQISAFDLPRKSS